MELVQRDTRRLDVSNVVGLAFDDGWLFARVTATEYVELKPFTLKNENGDREALSPNTAGTTNDRIQDSAGNNLLRPDQEDKNLIFHVMYGVAPSRMQVFELFGRNRPKGLANYDEPGDPAPITTGYDTPYNDPTEEGEMFVVAEQSRPKLQAFNPTEESLEANISFHVNKLRYGVITDKSVQRAMLQGSIPFKAYPMGGGAQDNDRLSLPSWMNERFGDSIRTTQEILTEDDDDGSGGGNGGVVEDIPGQGGGSGGNVGDILS